MTQQTLKPILFIVALNDLRLYEHVKAAFADVGQIAVIRDRRQGDRRRQTVDVPLERRRADRRRHDVSRALQGLGWAIVRTDG